MPTFVGALRSEVRHLAALEFRKVMKLVGRLETQLTDLSQDARKYWQKVGRIERSVRRVRERASAPLAAPGRGGADAADGPPIKPNEVRALRAGLRLSRHKFGDLIGVSHGTVYLWEVGRVEPRGSSRAKFLAAKQKWGKKAGLKVLDPKGRRPQKRR